MTEKMNTARRQRDNRTGLLLQHCLSLGTPERRPSARMRLDAAIGEDLARVLVKSLTGGGRR